MTHQPNEFKLPQGYEWWRDRGGNVVTMFAHLLHFGPAISFGPGLEADTEFAYRGEDPATRQLAYVVYCNTAFKVRRAEVQTNEVV